MPPTNRPRPVHFITFERGPVVIVGAAVATCCAAFSAAARRPSAYAGVVSVVVMRTTKSPATAFTTGFMSVLLFVAGNGMAIGLLSAFLRCGRGPTPARSRGASPPREDRPPAGCHV